MLVFFVSVMHVLWGILLLVNGGPISTTATSLLRHLLPDYELRAIVYILAGLMPATLLRWPGSVTGLLFCLPQQVLLILSAISAMVAITNGQFADGIDRGWIFLMADQGIYILLALLYSFEALDRYHER